jgi:DNA-directed RNA polymerase subunit alpha
MENGVVEVLTAPQLNLQSVASLKNKVAARGDDYKELETFAADYQSVSKVIPPEEQQLRLGLTQNLLGNFPEAIHALESDDSFLGRIFRIQALVALDRRGEARKVLSEALSNLIDHNDGLIELSILAMHLKDDEAMASLLSKLDLEQLGDTGLMLKGFQAELQGDYQNAIDDLGHAADGNGPYQGLALFHLAKLQDRWGDDRLALETYRRIETLGYSFEESLINTGILLEDMGEHAQAIAYYEMALKINPNNKRTALYHADAEACLSMYYDERKHRQDAKTFEILNIPISDFELSVRSRNCLSKMGIFTLQDLITKTEQELLSYKNFGDTSLKEIRAMLAKKGLHLGMTRVEEQPLADRIKMNAQLYSQEKDYNLDELDTSIEDLDLSYRTKSALHKMGFESLRDITMRTGTDLESNPNFSAACLQEVNAMLDEKGLSYRPATSSGKPETPPAATATKKDGSALLNDEGSIFEYD